MFSISTSRSILMHASLAYLSPQIRTIDFILRAPHPALPTEIMFLIRSHLLHILTLRLLRLTADAFAQYEACIRRLLCKDCLAYNQEVYGPEIWDWEHFTGACLCRGMQGRNAEAQLILSKVPAIWNEETAPRCSTWLELYLSSLSSRLQLMSDPPRSIWDVVDTVLEEYGCRLAPASQLPMIPSETAYCFLPHPQKKKVPIDIPVPVTIIPAMSRLENPDLSPSSILRRADRDLGLSFAYEKCLVPWKKRSHTSPHQGNRGFYSTPSWLANIASTAFRVTVVTICFPFTVALTLVCSYSNPRALRLL